MILLIWPNVFLCWFSTYSSKKLLVYKYLSSGEIKNICSFLSVFAERIRVPRTYEWQNRPFSALSSVYNQIDEFPRFLTGGQKQNVENRLTRTFRKNGNWSSLFKRTIVISDKLWFKDTMLKQSVNHHSESWQSFQNQKSEAWLYQTFKSHMNPMFSIFAGQFVVNEGWFSRSNDTPEIT